MVHLYDKMDIFTFLWPMDLDIWNGNNVHIVAIWYWLFIAGKYSIVNLMQTLTLAHCKKSFPFCLGCGRLFLFSITNTMRLKSMDSCKMSPKLILQQTISATQSVRWARTRHCTTSRRCYTQSIPGRWAKCVLRIYPGT